MLAIDTAYGVVNCRWGGRCGSKGMLTIAHALGGRGGQGKVKMQGVAMYRKDSCGCMVSERREGRGGVGRKIGQSRTPFLGSTLLAA